MSARMRTSVAVLAAAGALALPATPAAAEGVGTTAVTWSVSLGTAKAEGTRRFEGTSLVAEGRLSNTGPGCYSVWTQVTHDFVPGPAVRNATLCGPGAVDVLVRRDYWLPTMTGRITVCEGSANTATCAPWKSLV
ncbi:hypothetical protein AB0C77_11495 [Streptomyces sp. NPDC048629]|uniref:hypothetical protein n=1 Tax=Streptomyces sp. NPDC048629 TaxID=3154824 RepID=UPI003439CC66